jgi:hypothetical protein
LGPQDVCLTDDLERWGRAWKEKPTHNK